MEGVIAFTASAIICGIIQTIRYRNNVDYWNKETPYWYVSIVMRALMTICLLILIGIVLVIIKSV